MPRADEAHLGIGDRRKGIGDGNWGRETSRLSSGSRLRLHPVFYPRHNMLQGISRTFLSPELSIPGLLGFDANPSATATLGFACRSNAQNAERVRGHSQTGATRHPEV